MITRDRIVELLSYEPATGEFRWKVRRGNNGANVGDIAGEITRFGYRRICVDGRSYPAHHLAWLIHYGSWPSLHVDHIDRNRSNNAIENLREATSGQNRANSKVQSTSLSGIKGVGWHKREQKWQARISINGKLKHLGNFDKVDDAAAAYRTAATQAFGDFANPDDVRAKR
jgi:hypothetical protein